MANDREYGRSYGRQKSADPQEIGSIPSVANPKRRAETEASLERFLKLYFPWAFVKPWSPDHLRVIQKIELAINGGGLFALAMPRGSGKTSICERAALWAILTGRRKFVTLVGATEKKAEGILKSQKMELRLNDLLLEDYPEATFPIVRLENEARRCAGQKCDGEPTNIVWEMSQLVFPTIPEKYPSKSCGSVITVCGITGDIRGQKYTTPRGEVLRPSFVLIDDPQTRESAESETQCVTREEIIAGDILGMAGPGESISAVMPCTVIRRGDMADQLLNRKKHPDWNGERTKMLSAMPKNTKLLDEYAELRARLFLEERPLTEANRFWKANRKELEEGATASWPERKLKGDVSAIQHAVNLMLRDRAAFFAEYQNEPMEERLVVKKLPTADEICRKVNNVARGELAAEWTHVTGMIDVQKEVLFWAVCGWADDFSGGIIDYGTFPDQGRQYFALNELSVKLSGLEGWSGFSDEAITYAALKTVTKDLCSRKWKREDGAELSMERLVIDEGYQTDVVFQFCRQTDYSTIVVPSKGWGIKAGSRPMNDCKRKPGEKLGVHCRLSMPEGRTIRHLLIDTNHWKTFAFNRLAAPMGSAGCLSLFGGVPSRHRLFADHLKAESCTETEGHGRQVTEWFLRPGKPDNHWLDCLVGATCAASMIGCSLTGESVKAFAPRKERVPLAQMGR